MFRKGRRQGFKFTPAPINPISGQYANLRPDGTYPYCAMMQVAAEDEYDDYVICRGFDIRIPAFIDYEEGNPNKPGISVAKPFGSRLSNQYNIGEIYPALLPIQGTANYTPPSPSTVNWRLGQNPGVVDGDTADGHPESLDDTIEHLIDHNGKHVNWLLVDSGGDRVRLAQAPSGGIPARVGITPGSAVCTAVIIAPKSGVGFSAGDLVKTIKTFTVKNWDFDAHGADGDRIVQVSDHSDNALLIGASCTNEGDPDAIVLYEPSEMEALTEDFVEDEFT